MKKLLICTLSVIALAGCTKQDSDSELLNKIWKDFNKFPGNDVKGESYLDVKGEILKKGFVPPSALATSAKDPLPAYLACYDFIKVYDGLGDTKSNICIYYVSNPTRDTYSLMWRGRQYMYQLESAMVNDGFTTPVSAPLSNTPNNLPQAATPISAPLSNTPNNLPQVATPVSAPLSNTPNNISQAATPISAPLSNTPNNLPQVATTPPATISTSSTETPQETPIANVASYGTQVSNQDFAPSFDCLKSNSGQDRLVCSNKDLSKLDVQLSVLYSKARSNTFKKDAIKKEQIQWYKYQRNACADIECLSNAYQSRIFELSQNL